MPGFNTLKNKIVLMLMASVTLVLVLIAIISSFLVTQLHQENAEEKLLNNMAMLGQNLEQKRAKLILSGKILKDDEILFASTYLIWKYQDPSSQQTQIFNEEKKSLMHLLEHEVRTGGYAFAGIYSAKGEWLSFFDARKKARSYDAHESAQHAGSFESSVPIMTAHTSVDAELATYYVLSNDGEDLILMSRSPVRDQDDSSSEVIAWIYIGYILDKNFAESIAAKTGSILLIHGQKEKVDKDYWLASHPKNRIFSENNLIRMKKILAQVDDTDNHILGTSFRHEENHFSVMYPLDMESEEHLVVTFGLDKENLSSSLRAFQQTIFVVLFLSGIAVVPMGLLFARRSIIQPVKELTNFAKSLSRGESPEITGFNSKDELGTLAEAFNSMTEAIQLREESLRSKQREIRGIVDNAPSVISMKSPDGKYLMINHLFENLFDLNSEEIIGKTDLEIFSKAVALESKINDLQVLKQKKPVELEETIYQAGKTYTYISNKFPLLDNNGSVIAVCSIATDITARKNAEQKLTLAKDIIDNANEAIVVTDLNAVIEDVNDAYLKISGYSREEVIGQNPSLLQSGQHDKNFYKNMWQSIDKLGCWEGEMWDRRKNGEVYPKWLSINTVYDGQKPVKYVGIFSDITERKATEKQLKYLAYYDALTKLPNRVMFYDRLQQAISSAKRDASSLAIMMIDLDRFKYVNDTLGHDAGDELLRLVADQLKSAVRESDTVARIGGDEFKVILSDIKNADEASIVAQKIIDKLKQPLRVKGRTVNIGASIGISIYPDDGIEIEQLVKYTDLALYKAKDRGRNCYQFFSNDLQTQVFDHIEMERDMKKAIAKNEFVLHYQPKIDLLDDSVSGMESLIRWMHPEKGLIPPDQFIPFAEETGLIVPLGEWILNTACQQLRLWSDEKKSPLKLAINLSAIQFQQSDLCNVMKKIINEHGVNPEHIELEITESMVMTDVDQAINAMKELRSLGLKLAIDDFGTGYSSLSYLKRFPINTLKIDRSFVSELVTDSDDAAIVRAIISLAKDLDVEVVAEGVETEQQLEFLRLHDCRFVQGYYFSKPLAVDDFTAYLEKQRA